MYTRTTESVTSATPDPVPLNVGAFHVASFDDDGLYAQEESETTMDPTAPDPPVPRTPHDSASLDSHDLAGYLVEAEIVNSDDWYSGGGTDDWYGGGGDDWYGGGDDWYYYR